jgi:hypothetical protein
VRSSTGPGLKRSRILCSLSASNTK